MIRAFLLVICVSCFEITIYPYDSQVTDSYLSLVHALMQVSNLKSETSHILRLSSDEPLHYLTSAPIGRSRECIDLQACQSFLSDSSPGTSYLITSSVPNSPATLYLYEREVQFRITSDLNITFQDLTISGLKFLEDSCEETFCTHCHPEDDLVCDSNNHCITQEGYLVDNIPEFISDFGYHICNNWEKGISNQKLFFLLLNNPQASVIFRNVEFKDIRGRLNGLLNVISGTLMLYNVNFIRVESGNTSLNYYIPPSMLDRETSGIITSGILSENTDFSTYARIIYDTGKVIELNPMSPTLPLNSFMTLRNTHSVILRNITYMNNNSCYPKDTPYSEGKFSLIKIYQSYNITVESCRFLDNGNHDGVIYAKNYQSLAAVKVLVKNSEFIENRSMDKMPVLKFVEFPEVIIDTVRFEGKKENRCPALHVESRQLLINNSSFYRALEALKFTYTKGSNLQAMLNIENTAFTENLSTDHAGDLSIFGNKRDSLQMNIKDSNFTDTYSLKGGSIFIHSSVKFTSQPVPALIEHAIFQGISLYNVNSTITTSHSEGVLKVYRSKFQSIYSQDNASFLAVTEHGPNLHRLNQSQPETYISFQECIIKDNIGPNAILSLSFSVKNEFRTYSCLFHNNTSQLIRSQNTIYYDIGSTFSLNKAQAYAIYQGYYYSAVYFKNTLIMNNTVSDHGLVMAEQYSLISVENATFMNNISGKVACALFIGKLASAHIENSRFFNNTSRYGSAIYISSTTQGILVNNSEFGYNYSGSVIYLLSSSMKITNSYLHNLMSNSFVVGINAHVSNIELYNITIRDNYSPYGSFLFIQGSSYATVDSCLFENSVNFVGGSVYVEASDLILRNTRIQNVMGSKAALMIGLSMASISIENCSIYNITTITQTGDAMMYFLYTNRINITDTSIDRFTNQAILSKESQYFLLSNTTISNGVADNFSGGALQTDGNEIITHISDCTFINITARTGAGISFSGKPSHAIVINSRFENLKATGSAAILADDNSVNIIGCSFIGNSLTMDSTNLMYYEGRGGAVSFICSDESCRSRVKDCYFERNAAHQGGALFWNAIEPDMENVTFRDNEAVYGNNIANFPSKLALISNTTNQIENSNQLDVVVASGQNVPKFKVAMLDKYDQIYSTDNISTSIIKGDELCTISGDSSKIASNGMFTIESIAVITSPGSEGHITVSSMVCTGPKGEMYDLQGLHLKLNIRECIEGEIITNDSRCQVCPANTYSLELNSTYCRICPENAICKGGIKMYPYENYWRFSIHSDEILECPNHSACIGHDNFTSMTGKCLEGYTGNLCQVCDHNWARSGNNRCSECPEEAANFIRLIGLAILTSIILIFIIRKAILSAHAPKEHYTIYIRNFMNYLHSVSIIAMLDLSWPKYVKSFLNSQDSYSDISQQVISIDCFISNQYIEIDSIYIKLIIFTVLPFGLTLISVLFWGAIGIHRKKIFLMSKEMRTTVIILTFLLMPSMIEEYLTIIACRELEEGDYYLVNNLNLKCWKDDHAFYAYYISIPGAILWSIIIPNFGLFLLVRNRKKLHTHQIRLNYGFLYSGYRGDTYYWEFVIMFRKILILLIVSLYSTISIYVQAISVTVVLIISYLIQIRYKPYISPELNSLEEKCILVAGLTVYAGGFYLSGELSEGVKVMMFIVIIAANGYYLIYWFLGAIHNFVLKWVKSHPRVFRRFLKAFPKYRHYLEGGAGDEMNFDEHVLTLQELPTARFLRQTTIEQEEKRTNKIRLTNPRCPQYPGSISKNELGQFITQKDIYLYIVGIVRFM